MRGVVIGFITLFVVLIVGKFYLIVDAHKRGKSVYEIEVLRYGKVYDTYTTESYKFDENRCVTFTDGLGLERTICGEVNITKY